MRIIGLLLFFSSMWMGGCSSMKYANKQTPVSVDTNFHLYLLVGQSNMAGRAELDARSRLIDSSNFAFDSTGHWVYDVDPIHFDMSVAVVGRGISFAKAMLA